MCAIKILLFYFSPAYWKKEDLSTVISFWSVLHGGNMKGDFGWDGLAGRQGCERYSWLAEGGRLAGRKGGSLSFDVSSIIRATLPGLCTD